MSEDYPEPPTTAEAEFPLLSEAEDPEEYRDKWGQVIDDMLSRRLEEYLTGNREIPAAMVDELQSTTHSTEEADITERWDFQTGYRSGYKKITETTGYEAEPRILRVGDELVNIYRSGSEHVDNSGELVMQRSSDFGQSWSTPTTIFDTDNDTRNHCAHVTDSDRIVLLFRDFDASASSTTAVFSTFSDDGGETWANLNDITSFVDSMVPWQGGMVETSKGLMAGTNRTSNTVSAIFSADGGETWTEQTIVHDNGVKGTSLTEACPIRPYPQNDDAVLLIGRDVDSPGLWIGKSNDGGETWTDVEQFGSHNLIPFAKRISPSEIMIALSDRTAGEITTSTISSRLLMQQPDELLNSERQSLAKQETSRGPDFGYPSFVKLGASDKTQILLSWYDDDADSQEQPDIHQIGVAGNTNKTLRGDGLMLNPHREIVGIERGTIHFGPIQSTNDDFSDNDSDTVQVSFQTTFETTPQAVIITGESTDSAGVFFTAEQISSSGFQARAQNYRSVEREPVANYLAIRTRVN